MAALDFPASPTTGQLTSDGKFKFNGTGWVRVKGSNSSGGATMRTWASGTTFDYLEEVRSPSDKESYLRIAATGSDTTDPADDTTKWLATSYNRVTAIQPLTTAIANGASVATLFANNSIKVAIGVIAAGTRQNILSLTGKGAILYLGFQKAAAGGGRVEIICDGRTIYDQSVGAANTDVSVFIGSPGGATVSGTVHPAHVAVPESEGIEFRRTFQVFYTPATNATVATNSVLGYNLRAKA